MALAYGTDYATFHHKWKKLHEEELYNEEDLSGNHTLIQNALHGQIKAVNVPERFGDKSFARSLPPVVGRKFR
jgi:hypothetical protein